MHDNERERLYYLFQESKCPVHFIDNKQILDTVDYLLANGVIVPPCKVGDVVYIIYHEKVIQGTVRLIRPFISENETVFKGNVICEVDNLFFDDGTKEEVELYVVFEKTYGIERIAYLTREEAEKALAERSKG